MEQYPEPLSISLLLSASPTLCHTLCSEPIGPVPLSQLLFTEPLYRPGIPSPLWPGTGTLVIHLHAVQAFFYAG